MWHSKNKTEKSSDRCWDLNIDDDNNNKDDDDNDDKDDSDDVHDDNDDDLGGRWFTAGKSFSPDTDNTSCDCVRIVKNCCQRWWWSWYCLYDDDDNDNDDEEEDEDEDVRQVCEIQNLGCQKSTIFANG